MEPREKDSFTAPYLDDGEVKIREMKLRTVQISAKGVAEGNIWMFNEILRTGDVI
ncbi:MAG: hypothetical protein M0Z77_00875 [Thermoplasmatales archaeon]|jgi:hypothetical protein|nr:hypothetical protein [Thermoplasmatales archaeon]